ncbi:MAG TPA: methylenetetrahydrofolate reductase [NAD(P)H] [Burkholderiales bacterium]|jgi:methylenetetrahydrofolate reductase (NADPH)
MKTQKKLPPSFSFEFFPPRADHASAALLDTAAQLATVTPQFVSVTYGAGGSTRDGTYEAVKKLTEKGMCVAPHLSCVGATRAALTEQLRAYRALGVGRIVALRGDLPSGMASAGDFRFAYQLVELIRSETGEAFHIEVAAYPEMHPQARSPQEDLRHFKRKIDSGANSAITQYFYNADAYFRFIDECEAIGIDIAIVPGIMPITNYKQLARFSDGCGAEIPRWIRMRLASYGDDIESIRAFGLDVTTELCARLLAAGAPGLHFYTLNRAAPTLAIWQRLKL